MTSSTTDPHEVSNPPPVPLSAELHDFADRAAAALSTAADEWATATGAQACALLNVSPGGLMELVTAGRLDAVVSSGTVRLIAPQVQALALARSARTLVEVAAWRGQARSALVGYLAEMEATGDWDTCRAEHRPLVCARRGSPEAHVRFGIELHTVGLAASWVVEWALRHRETMPELASMPAGHVFADVLSELPGVEPVFYATALGGGSQHKLQRWIKVNPREFDLVLPAELADIVNGADR